jgi:hypothetical protein
MRPHQRIRHHRSLLCYSSWWEITSIVVRLFDCCLSCSKLFLQDWFGCKMRRRRIESRWLASIF